LEPINFELHEFHHRRRRRPLHVSPAPRSSASGWNGTAISVQPIESDGEFQIDGLQAHTIWEYLEDQLNFLVNSGSIDLNATYKFALKDAVDLKVDVSKSRLTT
jgi:hypothetical protein